MDIGKESTYFVNKRKISHWLYEHIFVFLVETLKMTI